MSCNKIQEILKAEDVLEAETVEEYVFSERSKESIIELREHFVEPLNALSVLHAVSNMVMQRYYFNKDNISLLVYIAWRDYIRYIENKETAIYEVRFSLYWL